MLHRAWSVLHLKAVDEESRTITGLATSASTDRMGDIVEPDGAEFKLPLPLLWQHDAKQPIGNVTKAKQTKAGIEIVAQFAQTDEPGRLKDRLDEAWQSVKLGLVRGLSIGFKDLDSEPIDSKNPFGGQRFLKWLWLELSTVTIPANADAGISTIRSLDVGLVAPDLAPVAPTTGAPVSRAVPVRITGHKMKTSYADQIATWVATRKEKTDAADALMSKSADTGQTLDAADGEAHDTLEGEIAEIDKQLARLRKAQTREAAQAVEVKGITQVQGLEARAGARISVHKTLPPGFMFARFAMCMANAKGQVGEALRLAQKYYPDDSAVASMIENGPAIITRAPVAGASTSGSHFIDDMIPYNVMNDFIEYLRPGSIIGKFGGPNPAGGANYPSLNRVGFNERVSGMSTGFSAGWKGEGLPALPSAAVTFNTALTWNCMAALCVMTKESIRFSNPNAEARVRDDLARAVNQKLDIDFIDPAKAVSGTTSPASITNGIVANTPSGTAATNVRKDIATIMGQFATANLDPSDVVFIMSGTMAAQIAMMTNTLGTRDFPELTFNGGNIGGRPVIVSEHLTALGSPSTQMIVAVKASEVYLADDGSVSVEASDQASIEQVDTSSQSAISGTGASLVSMFQTQAVAIIALREITWKLRRSTAVRYISPAAYVAA